MSPRPGPRRPLVCTRLTVEEIAVLDKIAKRDDMSRSDVIRRALERYVHEEGK